jgi:predicted phosphodiesterase
LSDTHCAGSEGKIEVPDGDLLIHAGDLTYRGTQGEVERELAWIDSLPHKHKVVVPGNHDWLFDPNRPASFRGWLLPQGVSVDDLMSRFPTITPLIDQSATIEGFKVYGSPWQPWFYDWAFNFPRHDPGHETAKATWAKIPDDTQILVTHSPPRGILDLTYGGEDTRAGCPELWKRIEALDHLRLHVFGHLHESYGREDWGERRRASR